MSALNWESIYDNYETGAFILGAFSLSKTMICVSVLMAVMSTSNNKVQLPHPGNYISTMSIAAE